MTTKYKMYGRPEGCICEQFAYRPNIDVYPNSSNMNELGETVALKMIKEVI